MPYRPSLRQILIAAFAALCVLPVLTLAVWLYFGVQNRVLDEARDKNQLLAQNLATPIQTYLVAARQSLAGLSYWLEHSNDTDLAAAASQQHYFHHLLLISREGTLRRWSSTSDTQAAQADATLVHIAEPFFDRKQAAQSGVIRNPYGGAPTVMFSYPLGDKMVIGLFDLQPVIALGQRIKFGEKGHAVITDQFGNVVLHPNSKWIGEIRNISDWPIIRSGLEGKTGVSRFFSPFLKQDMVAGYAAVPGFNWVVITPQPLSEYQERGNAMLRTAGWIALASIAIGMMLAAVLSGWIAGPISALAEMMRRLPYNGYQTQFQELATLAPRELDTLQRSSAQMARDITSSLTLRDNMNQELKRQVEEATRNLQEANTRLAAQAFIDDLTKLSNRRALWKRISDLERTSPETYLPIQVLLFDLDNFKEINDTFGHVGGDRILTEVAGVLARETREGDFVVRYGGDEFLIIMNHCLAATAQHRAETIRQAIMEHPIEIDGKRISVSLSVGIAESESRLSRPTFAELLKAADMAMYATKRKKPKQKSTA